MPPRDHQQSAAAEQAPKRRNSNNKTPNGAIRMKPSQRPRLSVADADQCGSIFRPPPTLNARPDFIPTPISNYIVTEEGEGEDEGEDYKDGKSKGEDEGRNEQNKEKNEGREASTAQALPFVANNNETSDWLAMNGINGGGSMPGGIPGGIPGGMPGGMGGPGGIGVPAPAGHQSELNYIYGMVEELSRQLADNRKATEDIVAGLGRVRQKAKEGNLSNDDILLAAAGEINGQEGNLEVLVSILSEALEKAKHSRDGNMALLNQFAQAMATMLKQFHEYKARHVADVCAWHRSYRAQLADERAENRRLREQIWDTQEHAGRANSLLREFRRKFDDGETRHERRVSLVALRQEVRFWKRMAMPEIPDDDSVWSNDDDLIDPAEKERQHRLEEQQAEAGEADDGDDGDDDGGDSGGDGDSDGDGDGDGNSENDDDGPEGIRVADGYSVTHSKVEGSPLRIGRLGLHKNDSGMPPRPVSAASSTGSTGHK